MLLTYFFFYKAFQSCIKFLVDVTVISRLRFINQIHMAISNCFGQYMEKEKIDNSETSKKVSKSQKSRQILTSCCNFPKESYVLTRFLDFLLQKFE